MLKTQVIGFLGKDATVNEVSGKHVINFSVAHTEKYNGNEKTVWVDCAYWTDKTKVAEYLKKGVQVHADGTPEIRTYAKKDGGEGVSFGLRVNSLQLLSGTTTAQEAEKLVEKPKTHKAVPIQEEIDDLPF